MRVLMLGWEFPPNFVGGLGTHTYGLVRALSRLGVGVTLFLPSGNYENIPGVEFVSVPVEAVNGVYLSHKKSREAYDNLFDSVKNYAKESVKLALSKRFDIIQANDWITAEAGMEIKKATGKPLLLTMHSLEYDRTAGKPWKEIEEREKRAVNGADLIIAVSNRLKEEIIRFYGCRPSKIKVIYNAIDLDKFKRIKVNRRKKLVLYVGRLSPQKGLSNLFEAFKTVAASDKEATLGIAGEGSEMQKLIDMAIDSGLRDRIIFFGRVSEGEKDYLYSIASIFVMPSVSEPFGITALEAAAYNTPVIVSKQSGVSEILNNVFKIDFWDSNQIADIILGVLNYPALDSTISEHAKHELGKITWKESAKKFVEAYRSLAG